MQVIVLLLACLAQDPARDLKSKDFDKRIAAVVALSADKSAEKALLSLIKDKDEDWELLERAALGLSGSGTAASVDPLVKLALNGPIVRVRLAAARTLAKIAPDKAAEELAGKLASPQAGEALEALAQVLRASTLEKPLKPIEKLLEKSKQPELAPLAARALLSSGAPASEQRLEALLKHARIDVVCAALEAAAEAPRAAHAPALRARLERESVESLVERRLITAVLADASSAPSVLESLSQSKSGLVRARAVRMAERAAAESAMQIDRALLAKVLDAALDHKDENSRAAAAKAFATCGTEGAQAKAAMLLSGDASARVRVAALASHRALLGRDSAGFDAAAAVYAAALEKETHREAREMLCVALGLKGSSAAAAPLIKALADPEWSVAVCAAVSLGRTQTGAGLEALVRVLKESKDWRLRGAAAAGLGQSYLAGALEPLIETLGDPDRAVSATAEHFLGALTLERLGPKPEPWRDWLAQNRRSLDLRDPVSRAEETARERERGTFVDRRSAKLELTRIYQNLALFVLESRGDHIERLFEHFEIGHVRTQAGKLPEIALQPDALFVSNCTGEIETPDVERLRWFVLCGGHLFGSCWALTETIGRAFPGVLRKIETASEVLDQVEAYPATLSGYLDGVFGDDVRPIYELQGAHLIQVLDPERVEVLIDSPACAERWGSGELAVWFRAGHGTVLDSVNHFDVQGLELAEGLKTPLDRQAYAIDHMSLSYADWRATRSEKFWDNALKASSQIPDLSVFRLVSNFVNRWRASTGR
jgi:HEAT repeat protein